MKNTFESKLGFILTAVGSAVGMANIWGFPYKLADGGLVFLIFYIIFAVIFCYVGLAAEFGIGRAAQSGALGAYEYAYRSTNKNSKLAHYIGYIPLLGNFSIAVGYAVIVSYIFKALVDSINGTLMVTDPTVWFDSFSSIKYSVMPYHLIVIAVTLFTCYKGANSIEKSNKIMMPAFFVLFLGLAIKIATLPGAVEGYSYMFRFDPSKINLDTIIAAMGQAFFSLSITGSGMIVVGAYLKKDIDIVASSKQTGLFDTLAGVLASCVMIPALSVYNMQQVGGPQLLFIALPTILQNMAFGRVLAIILYLAVICAGISSLQNMFEMATESITRRFVNVERKYVLIALGLIAFLIGINMETIGRFGPYMDIVSIYIIPIGASIGAITWFYIMDKKRFIDEINVASKKKYGDSWHNIGRYIYVPLAVILTILALVFKISF